MAQPKILVAVKQVAVVSDELEVSDGTIIDEGLERAFNEWDLHAVEESIRLREHVGRGEIVVVTVGDEEAEQVLRRALAMGVDRAVRVDGKPVDPITTARMLAAVADEESPDLILCGAQSSDSVQGATGAALAELLRLPVAAVVTHVRWSGAGSAVVHRELEGGLVDVVEIETPCVLTIQTGINEPRYVTLRAIKQADQVTIPVVAAELASDPGYRVVRLALPERGSHTQMLTGTEADIAARILELVRERVP